MSSLLNLLSIPDAFPSHLIISTCIFIVLCLSCPVLFFFFPESMAFLSQEHLVSSSLKNYLIIVAFHAVIQILQGLDSPEKPCVNCKRQKVAG